MWEDDNGFDPDPRVARFKLGGHSHLKGRPMDDELLVLLLSILYKQLRGG